MTVIQPVTKIRTFMVTQNRDAQSLVLALTASSGNLFKTQIPSAPPRLAESGTPWGAWLCSDALARCGGKMG